MGAGASSLGSGALNRVQMIKATESPRFLLDRILRFMMDEINDKDVFRMQDPGVCEKYLILTADAMQKYFIDINILPTKDKSGKLYFRRITDLQKPRDKVVEEQLKSNCLTLAYFYVRILQIYIALALTIVDDPRLIPGASSLGTSSIVLSRPTLPGARISGGDGSIPASALGLKGGALPKMIYVGSGSQSGGDGTEFTINDLVKERILVPAATSGKYTFRERVTITAETKGQSDIMVVTQESLLNQSSSSSSYGYGYGYGSGSSSKPKVVVQLSIADGSPRINIIEFSRQGRSETASNTFLELTSNYEPRDSSFGSTLAKFFETVLGELNRGQTTMLDKLKAALSEKYGAYNYNHARSDGSLSSRQLERVSLQSSSAVPALDFSRSLQDLSGKPLAHCLARSFQLLNIDALGPKVPASARSSICKTKFLMDGSSDEAPVPGRGESIKAIPGINALNFLFFVLGKNIKLSDRTRVEYAAAMTELSRVFSDSPKKYDAAQLSGKMDELLDIRSKGRCDSSSEGRELPIAGQQVAIARKGVAALWGYQVQHALKVEALFKQLFAVTKSQQGQIVMGFNQNILVKGLPEIERIASLARTLLVDYYSHCEDFYQKTVSAMVATK
jgi:hypothetical protein